MRPFQLVNHNPLDILLVEDNPGDVRLTKEVLGNSNLPTHLNVASDGVEAINYLRHRERYAQARRPDLVLLDLNLPRKDGREVLAEIKGDSQLRTIPVVVLTTSAAEEDIRNSYSLQANCYITKPVDLEQFTRVVKNIHDFWLTTVRLPSE